MRRYSLLAVISILFTTLCVVGCSSGGSLTTPEPGDSSYSEITKISGNFPVGVSDYFPDGTPAAGMGSLGLFNLHIDPVNVSAEITSMRSASLPDVLEVVDITNFLQLWPCTDCVKLQSVSLNDDGNLVASIGIKHPFEEGDPFKPITGRNRGDLHVFNVEGIIFSSNPATSFPGLGRSAANVRLLNASGYTGYLDPVMDDLYPTSATIHPYILHFDDYSSGNYDPNNPMGFVSVTDPHPSGNLVMAMGSDYDFKDYVFAMPDEPMDFIYAIGCTYAVSSATRQQRFNPEYRVPQHLKKAASEVWVDIVENDLAGEDTESSATLQINVVDISHGVPVGDALNEMLADSSVSAVSVEVPNVTLGTISFSTTPISGSGHDPDDPLVFEGEITNAAGADEGIYLGLVKITDSYPPGLNESPLLDGMDGIQRVSPVQNPLEGLFAIPEFATYQVFSIDVETGNEPPVAILNPNPARGCEGASIWFNGSNSYDPDGEIVLYEFDFNLADGDPDNFEADVSGTEHRVRSPVYDSGDYYAALRVTDNLGETDIDVVEVIITPIDGLDITPYPKVDVTDDSFSNIIFTPNGFLPREWNALPRALGMQAVATGDSCIFAVFYADGDDGRGLYVARSCDEGESWGDYQFIHPFSSPDAYRGAAVEAVGSEVFIATIEYNVHRYYLYYNDDNGEGDYQQYMVYENITSTPQIGHPSVAVDPANTDNIYLSFSNYTSATTSVSPSANILTSNAGPAGTFTISEELFSEWLVNWHMQIWTCEIKVAPDGRVYLIQVGNHGSSTHRSSDYGATWERVSDRRHTTFSRHSDFCFDPNDPETIYKVVNRRYYNTIQYYRSTNGGLTWSTLNSNFQTSTESAYSNAAIGTDLVGNVYAVYTDVTPGYAVVYGRFSPPGGGSFGAPVQISTDTDNDGHVDITTTTNGCDVIIVWLENRDDAQNRRIVSQRG